MYMDAKRHCKVKNTEQVSDKIENADKYAGVAVNDADGDKVTDKLVSERTKALNNNPRNNES